jgi:predicted transcriptional regulator
MVTKRGKLSIILDLHKACFAGASKTNIVYPPNLNIRTITLRLNLLIDRGVIGVAEESVTSYKTIDKGSNRMRNLKGILNKLGNADGPRSSR